MARQMFDITAPNLSAKARVFSLVMSREMDKGMEAGVRAASIMLAGEVQDLLEGKVLNKRTGKLWRSFSSPKVYRRGGRWIGVVGTNVKYAAIHEFGGTIVPRDASVLRFRVGNRTVFAKRVRIPKRPYVSRTFKEHGDEVPDIIQQHIEDRMERVLKVVT